MTNGVFLDPSDLSTIQEAAEFGVAVAPKILTCPADRAPKDSWIVGPPAPPKYAYKSYAMNSCGVNSGSQVQVSDNKRAYPLPSLNLPGAHGVGIYWTDPGSTADWNARGYSTAVVRDTAGTILLAEDASSQAAVGNIWPCVCLGPQVSDGANGGWGNMYQTDLRAPQDAASLTVGGYSEGFQLYKAHHNRFNYVFHDNHVESLKIEQTIGTGTLANPKGMWTIAQGD